MRKIFLAFISCLLGCMMFLAFASCADPKKEIYIPTEYEIGEHLANAGYKDIYQDLTISQIELADGSCITQLSIEREKEYLEYYRLDTPEQCETYYSKLAEQYPDCDVLVKIVNDKNYGCVVFCGTQSIIHAAGIKIASEA